MKGCIHRHHGREGNRRRSGILGKLEMRILHQGLKVAILRFLLQLMLDSLLLKILLVLVLL